MQSIIVVAVSIVISISAFAGSAHKSALSAALAAYIESFNPLKLFPRLPKLFFKSLIESHISLSEKPIDVKVNNSPTALCIGLNA
ncbi:hypothetical protein J6P11_01640 [bacterium]|nr:hypothetical protein [bacterium]